MPSAHAPKAASSRNETEKTMTASPPRRSNSEVLTATLELQGKKVVDVGCGEGHLVRLMTRHGAKAFGIELNPKQLEKAHAEKTVGDEVYYEGRAENLPFDSDSIDITVFFNSLHHVDVKRMGDALAEAARVLKSGGVLYVCEPVAEGPHFELMKPVHNETKVRAKAYEALQAADNLGFTVEDEFTYIHPAVHKSFTHFKERMLRVNPEREDSFAKLEGKLQKAFDTLGKPADAKDGGGFTFDQPMRVNVLTKA